MVKKSTFHHQSAAWEVSNPFPGCLLMFSGISRINATQNFFSSTGATSADEEGPFLFSQKNCSEEQCFESY